MHRSTRLALGAAIAALAAASAASAAAPGARTVKKHIICRAALVSVAPPGTAWESYGRVSCTGRAFGDGVQHDTAQLARSSETAASLRGRFTMFFDTGTIRGTYRTAITVAGEVASFRGTAKVTSGTGALRGARGTGTIAGTSLDPIHPTLTERLSLTLPAG